MRTECVRIGKKEMSGLFNHTGVETHTHTHARTRESSEMTKDVEKVPEGHL